eukprot:IDg14990t1
MDNAMFVKWLQELRVAGEPSQTEIQAGMEKLMGSRKDANDCQQFIYY